MNSEEQACVQLLLEMFCWEKADKHFQYKAFSILRVCRGLEVPTFDDFVAGTCR